MRRLALHTKPDACRVLLQGQRVINPYESRWFWIVLVANPVVWALLCLSALLGLDWGERAAGMHAVTCPAASATR